MKIADEIQKLFKRNSNRVLNLGSYAYGGYTGTFGFKREPFADLIFLNIVELITDLSHDVVFNPQATTQNKPLYDAFINFYNTYGKVVLNMLYRDGIVVIGRTQSGEGKLAISHLHICKKSEYTHTTINDETIYTATNPDVELYVMKSPAMMITGKSDRQLLTAWMDYLDDVLTGSAHISRNLGSLLLLSPKAGANSAIAATLTDKERKEMEKDFEKNYGSASEQSMAVFFKQEMGAQVVNMAGLDQRTREKANLAICAICDRLKVPANQVAIIDANSSKSLANGTELREGDLNKYQTFERMLDATFLQMARDMQLRADFGIPADKAHNGAYDYTMENKPKQKQPTQV